mmetsp:Transcript_18159/g.63811  ORF Transcript_18159/g.63811 Transcript_18159/m.63811 type:complete len:200 (+) Transcript_18159:95-694(+)
MMTVCSTGVDATWAFVAASSALVALSFLPLAERTLATFMGSSSSSSSSSEKSSWAKRCCSERPSPLSEYFCCVCLSGALSGSPSPSPPKPQACAPGAAGAFAGRAGEAACTSARASTGGITSCASCGSAAPGASSFGSAAASSSGMVSSNFPASPFLKAFINIIVPRFFAEGAAALASSQAGCGAATAGSTAAGSATTG